MFAKNKLSKKNLKNFLSPTFFQKTKLDSCKMQEFAGEWLPWRGLVTSGSNFKCGHGPEVTQCCREHIPRPWTK